jgi:hypothetical protein
MAEIIGSDYACMSDECSQDIFSLWASDSWSVGDPPVLPSVFDAVAADPLGSPLDDLPLASPENFFDAVESPETNDSPTDEGESQLAAAANPEWFSDIFAQVRTDKIAGFLLDQQNVVYGDNDNTFGADEELINLNDNIAADNSDTILVADSGRHSACSMPMTCPDGDAKLKRRSEFANVIQGENRIPDCQQANDVVVPDISEHSYGSSLKLPSYYANRRRVVQLPGGKMRLDVSRQQLSKNSARSANIGQSTTEMCETIIRKAPKRVAARRTEIVSESSSDEDEMEDDYCSEENYFTATRRRRDSTGRTSAKRSSRSDEVTSTRRGASSDINKNALNARINRQKKKAYIASLEAQRARLGDENRRLKSALSEVTGERDDLRDEVDYLKLVLTNESVLARLIEGINGGPSTAQLSAAIGVPGRKRKCTVDSGYSPSSEKYDAKAEAPTGGVCLHVRQDQLSVEFCHRCAQMSERGARARCGNSD